MGNAIARLNTCLCPTAAGDISRRIDLPEKAFRGNQQLDDNGLGHSFCYIPSHHFAAISSSSSSSSSSFGGAHPARMVPLFRAISGASISANTSTQLSTALYLDSYSLVIDRASSFESSSCFASVPLQPIPRGFMVNSGPLTSHTSGSLFGSGPMERGFLSGPIERGFTSGPIQDEVMSTKSKYKLKKWGSIKGIKESILASIWGPRNGYDSVNQTEWENSNSNHKYNGSVGKSNSIGRVSGSLCEDTDGGGGGAVSSGGLLEEQNYEWAQGKAGEDRVHIVVSQDQGWVFVGIYDGFNGPDAPDFLLSNLYSAVHDELKGLFPVLESESEVTMVKDSSKGNGMIEVVKHELGRCDGNENSIEVDDKTRKRMNKMGVKWWDKVRHSEVVKALSEALRKTEESYLDIADKMVKENPELCLMGSCLLVMLMMGEDIYLMNVGDSRAVLGQKSVDLDSIDDISSLQLTMDHNTYVKEEVKRIRNRHLDDPSALVNHRVKGSLKVTRAFGAGFLKHPKWNEALLKSFRIEYVGNLPYITCRPSLSHHKLSPRDKFLILSSDGLFQYFTNDEAVSEVELFMASTPEGDPAQHLIEEVLFRAAKRAGMDFHELLEIPQGERRRYHDDVSVIVISLEGTIWRSSV